MFCAICAGDIAAGTGFQSPLGKNDALVAVCKACFSEPAREKVYEGPAYSPESFGGMHAQVRDAKLKIVGHEEPVITPPVNTRRTGWVVLRIAKYRRGVLVVRDGNQAYAIAVKKVPPGTPLHYVTVTPNWYLYEYPPRPVEDPLEPIRKYKDSP